MIENDLRSVPHGRVGITKVLAHRSVQTASTALEEWCFQHNQFSDHAAAMANVRRPAAFWDLLSRHIQACTLVDNWNTSIQRVLVNISHRVLQIERPAPVLCFEPSIEVCAPQWTPLPSLAHLPSGAVSTQVRLEKQAQ